jgi:hypothetical protein
VKLVARLLAGLAVVGGLVLGGIGIVSLQSAGEDQDRADGLAAEVEEGSEPLADAGQRIRVRARAAQRLDRANEQLELAVYDYWRLQSDTIGAFNVGAAALDADDPAGIDRALAEDILPKVERLHALAERHATAEASVGERVRALREALG